MPREIFISYSWIQKEWVKYRLVPVLKAAEVEPLIDEVNFRGGRALDDEIEEWQNRADASILVLSQAYTKSEPCMQELRRAVARDPAFSKVPPLTIPLLREDCTLPTEIEKPNPLHLDFQDDHHAETWSKLLKACKGLDLRISAPRWLDAFKKAEIYLSRGCSVNLVAEGAVEWRGMVRQLQHSSSSNFPTIDLFDPHTESQEGLVQTILRECGLSQSVEQGQELIALHDALSARAETTHLAIVHFDVVKVRGEKYAIDLFYCLAHLIFDLKKLVLLTQSRTGLATLLPPDHAELSPKLASHSVYLIPEPSSGR